MSTYPNEAYPSNATIESLDGTTDSLTGLPYVAKGVNPTSNPSYEVQYNRRLHRQNQVLAGWRQGMVVDEGSLKIGVYPIRYRLGGTSKSYTGATNQSVPDNSTRYVYLDSNNVLQIQSSWPSDAGTYLPLAEVVTAAGATSITDKRVEIAFGIDAVEPIASLVVADNNDTTATITVTIKDKGGTTLPGRHLVRGWLSDTAYEKESTTTPSSGFSVPSVQLIKSLTTNLHLFVATDANGQVVFTVVHTTGAKTWYFNAEVSGRLTADDVVIT